MGNQGNRVIVNGLTIDYSPVTVDAILTPENAAVHGIETNKHRVQLRQTVKTTYPASRGNALFAPEAFGPGKDFEEKRVTWLDVPQGTTVEEVVARLEQLPSPTLVRTLGLIPILTENQRIAMEKGINTKTWDQYLENFVRTGSDGEPVMFQGRLQYRAIHFSDSFTEDNDGRLIDLKQLQNAEKQNALAAVAGETGVQMADTEATEAQTASEVAQNSNGY